MADITTTVETVEQLGNVVARWSAEIEAYDKLTERWRRDSKRINARFKLEKDRSQLRIEGQEQFNILWSNVKVSAPALFNRAPVPSIERRHRDQDIVGRVAATMLERAVSTDLENDEIDDVMKRVTQDYQLVGRGVPWVRYEADIVENRMAVTQTDFGPVDEQGQPRESFQEDEDGLFVTERDVVSEESPVDYIFWQDFGHTPAKTWKEVQKHGAAWKRVLMTRRQLVKRFGEVGKKVPLTVMPEKMSEKDTTDSVKDVVKKARVYEIWDAEDRKVIWIVKEFKERALDEKPFPLDLGTVFPCPPPAFGTLGNDSLIPVPDYLQYEDLAEELDDLTARISTLQRALAARGVYDASAEGIGRLLSGDSSENALIPVENWPALTAKGGIDRVIQWLPIDMIAQVLLQMEERRAVLKQNIFEISGISDILRGEVDPREKLGQSRIKGQFATLRLEGGQKELARVARDVVRIKAEIISEVYDPATVREMSGFDHMPEIRRLKTEAEQRQQNPDEAVEQLFSEAMDLIRSDRRRGFRIDIETDSTIAVDEEQARQSRVDFLQAAGSFLQQAIEAGTQAPAMAPLLGEMLLFGVRGFKAGRQLESAFESAMEQLREPQQEQQDPAAAAQAMAQAELEMKREQMLGELEIKREQIMAEVELKREQAQAQVQSDPTPIKMNLAREQAAADLQLKREVAIAEQALKREELEADMALRQQSETVLSQATGDLTNNSQAMAKAAEDLAKAAAQISESADMISQAAGDIAAPREIVRDDRGRATGTRKREAA